MKILIKAIYPYLFLVLYLVIPFDNYIRAFPNLLLGLLVLFFPFAFCKKEFLKLDKIPTLIFITFFVYLFVSAFLLSRFQYDFDTLKKMLIPFGLVILYLPLFDINKIKKAILFSSVAAILFSVFQFAVHSFSAHDVSLLFFQNTVDGVLIDRPYLGLLAVLSIIISYQALSKKYSPYNIYYVTNIVINVIFILLIMSKVAIAILIALFIIRQFYGTHKKITIPLILFIVLIGSFGFYKMYFPKLKKEISTSNNQVKAPYNMAFLPNTYRSIIWSCATQIATQNANNFVGIGFKNTNNKLVDCYKKSIPDTKTKNTFVTEKFNTHNQYIDIFISSGWIGLLLFISFWIVLLRKHHKNYFTTALLVSILIFGLTENYLHRQIGAYYFGVLLIFLLINNSKKELKQEL